MTPHTGLMLASVICSALLPATLPALYFSPQQEIIHPRSYHTPEDAQVPEAVRIAWATKGWKSPTPSVYWSISDTIGLVQIDIGSGRYIPLLVMYRKQADGTWREIGTEQILGSFSELSDNERAGNLHRSGHRLTLYSRSGKVIAELEIPDTD